MENLLNLTYTEKEDGLLYPNIDMENENQTLGRFGWNWMDYMHQNHSQRFMSLWMQGKLEETSPQGGVGSVSAAGNDVSAAFSEVSSSANR